MTTAAQKKIHYHKNKELYIERARKFRREHPDRAKQYRLNSICNNPENFIFLNCRKGAKKRGIEFSLEVSDIKIPKYCPVLHIKLSPIGSSRKTNGKAPSLDRIDNTKGYVKGNVLIISDRANRLKNDATIDEIQKVLAYMQKYNCI